MVCRLEHLRLGVLLLPTSRGKFSHLHVQRNAFNTTQTKNLTLEELDVVFNIGNKEHFTYYSQKAPWYLQKFMRKDVPPFEPLCQLYEEGPTHATSNEKTV